MPEGKGGLLRWIGGVLREALGELLIAWFWWGFWGAMVGAPLGGASGFVMFGWTGLLWGMAIGAAGGAVLGVFANIVVNTGNPFD